MSEHVKELVERRERLGQRLRSLAMMNTPSDAEDQLKALVQYRLAFDAWEAADKEYREAIGRLSVPELEALANGTAIESEFSKATRQGSET